MKFVVALLLCISTVTSAFAENLHFHPKSNSNDANQISRSVSRPGQCDIEVINDSHEKVYVYGEFDDGEWLRFSILPHDLPHRISLFYYGYCHQDMYLSIDNFKGHNLYSGYPRVRTSIQISTWNLFQQKAEVKA